MKKTYVIFSFLKGVLISLVITVLGVCALALFLKEAEGNFISLISVIVKIISIISGTVIATLKIRKRGVITGISISLVYWIGCLLLSMLAQPFQFDIKMLIDLIFTVFIGALAGVLTVNALKRN